MANIPVLGTGNVRRAFISLKGKRVPVTLRLPQHEMFNADFATNNILKRIVRPAVQDRLLSELQVSVNPISRINIGPSFGKRSISKGALELPFEDAEHLRGNKLARVLSGGTDRAISFIGSSEVYDEAGLDPDFKFGTSGGALACVMDKESVFKVAKSHPWTDFLDFNLRGLRDITTFGGIIKGNRLIDIIARECGLQGLSFADAGKPIFVTAGDLRDGHAYVFCDTEAPGFREGLIYDPDGEKPSNFRETFMPRYMGSLSVTDALRASYSIPVVFEGQTIGQHRFVDGAMRLNCALKAAANMMDVGRILAETTGYTEQPEAGKNNVFTDFNGWEDMRSWDQLDHLNHHIMRGISVRLINPGAFNVPTPSAYENAQKVVGSARDTMRKIFDVVPPERFFAEWSDSDFQRLAPRFSAKWWGEERSNNIVSIVDTKSPIATLKPDDPFWAEVEREDGCKITSPAPRSPMSLLVHDYRERYGLARTLVAGAYLGTGLALRPWLLKEKKKQGPQA